jgi:hypothetical protein
MKIILDIKDNKAAFFMELLKSFNYVKTKPLTPAKAQFLEEMKQAVDELNLIKSGKKKAKNAEDFLNEL